MGLPTAKGSRICPNCNTMALPLVPLFPLQDSFTTEALANLLESLDHPPVISTSFVRWTALLAPCFATRYWDLLVLEAPSPWPSAVSQLAVSLFSFPIVFSVELHRIMPFAYAAKSSAKDLRGSLYSYLELFLFTAPTLVSYSTESMYLSSPKVEPLLLSLVHVLCSALLPPVYTKSGTCSRQKAGLIMVTTPLPSCMLLFQLLETIASYILLSFLLIYTQLEG